MSNPSELDLINIAVVAKDGQERTYSILFHGNGVTGNQVSMNQAEEPERDFFTIAWSDIRCIIRRSGILHWGMIIELASGSTVDIWVSYEHHTTAFFEKLQKKYESRAQFHTAPAPLWKFLVVPLAIAGLSTGGGVWAYQVTQDNEAKRLGPMTLVDALFGSTGVLLLFSFWVLFWIGYGFWLICRESNARKHAKGVIDPPSKSC